MLNDKRLCQLVLPSLILFSLADDNERSSRAIRNYCSKHMIIFCDANKFKLRKISNRVSRTVTKIKFFCADSNYLKGTKMVLTTHFLTQLIFDEKEGNITESYREIAAVTKRLVEFCSNIAQKDTKDEDFDKIASSAEKLARKVYEKFYKII